MSIYLFSNKIVLVDNIPAIPSSRNRLAHHLPTNASEDEFDLSIETLTDVAVGRLQEE